jgi:predicted dehydrogenase
MATNIHEEMRPMDPRQDTRSTTETTRRGFLGTTGRIATAAAATTFSGTLLGGRPMPRVHAAGGDEIRVALIGCGGRGGGAAADALSVAGAPLKLVAMADIFADRMKVVKRSLAERFKERIDVPDERAFVGVEAYKQALECLRPGDIAIFATPPAFRATHFAAAIEKGVHTFMEKPVSIDGPSTRRIIDLAARAEEKGLKVGVGLMCRHCDRRRELFDRLRNGEAGDLIAFRGYRMHGPVQSMDLYPGPPAGMTELQWQIKRFHSFLWASGGVYSDFYVHHIDEVCWMKDAWPVLAEATGGRQVHEKIDDQNFDNYAIEYTFDDGTKFFYAGRTMKDVEQKFGAYGQGSKGAFTISGSGHSAKSVIYKGQRIDKDDAVWTAAQPEPNPYAREWEHLVAAILADEPYNEAVRGAQASLVTAMGRFAAHTGRAVTYDEMLACPDDLTVAVASLTDSSPAPLARSADGTVPVPMPGKYKFEYRD